MVRGLWPPPWSIDHWLRAAPTPIVKQQQESDCGLAALAMVAGAWGRHWSVDELAHRIPPTARGVRLGALRDLARTRGLDAYALAASSKDLAHELRAGRPVMLGLVLPFDRGHDRSHYEVAVAMNPHDGSVITIDPATRALVAAHARGARSRMEVRRLRRARRDWHDRCYSHKPRRIPMSHLRMLAVALGLVAANGCKSETERKSDKAAENVVEQRHDLDEQMNKRQAADDDHGKDVDKKAGDLLHASDQFEMRKAVRIAGLRAEREVISTQPSLINSLSNTFSLTSAGHTDVAEKVDAFKAQLDEVTSQLTNLESTGADQWKERDDAMTDAMKKLEDARDAAWKALESAPREVRSS